MNKTRFLPSGGSQFRDVSMIKKSQVLTEHQLYLLRYITSFNFHATSWSQNCNTNTWWMWGSEKLNNLPTIIEWVTWSQQSCDLSSDPANSGACVFFHQALTASIPYQADCGIRKVTQETWLNGDYDGRQYMLWWASRHQSLGVELITFTRILSYSPIANKQESPCPGLALFLRIPRNMHLPYPTPLPTPLSVYPFALVTTSSVFTKTLTPLTAPQEARPHGTVNIPRVPQKYLFPRSEPTLERGSPYTPI